MYTIIANIFLILWVLNAFDQLRSLLNFRIKYLQTSISDFKSGYLPSIGIGFLAKDWRSEFLTQSQLWRSQIWDYRRFLFSSTQSLLSYFWLFLVFVLFFEVSGYIVIILTISLYGLVHFFSSAKFIPSLKTFVYFSLVFLFLELSFKNSSLLMQFLMDSELVFFTTIDSNLNLLILLVGATVVGFILPIQGWSLVVTFLFFLNSQLSYLGFISIVVGEFLGTTVYLLKQIQSWDSFYQKKIKGLLYFIVGYLVLFLVALYTLRSLVGFGEVFSKIFILKWIYLGTLLIFLAGLYATIMTWGHFKSQSQEKEVSSSDRGLAYDFNFDESDLMRVFIKQQLLERREKLKKFKQELESDPQSKAKIPPFVLNQFETEIELINKIEAKTKR